MGKKFSANFGKGVGSKQPSVPGPKAKTAKAGKASPAKKLKRLK